MSANKALSNEIATKLRREILTGQHREGDRLASERDLASRFGASRGAVREALQQLEQLRLIEIQPGGARVKPLAHARIAVLGPLMDLDEVPDPVLVQQFIQTFGALAALTMEQAVLRADAAQLNRLQEYVVELGRQNSDLPTIHQKWREFFTYVAELADNLVVQLIRNDLKAQFVEQIVKLGVKPKIQSRVLSRILTALKQGMEERNQERVGCAVRLFFEELSLSVGQAISQIQPDLRQEAS